MRTFLRICLLGPLIALVAGCASTPTEPVQSRANVDVANLTAPVDPPAIASLADQGEVADLARTLLALSPTVDPEEAARAAAIAYTHTAELKVLYQITDPPLLHNAKVNSGARPRGLCWHWAEDMQKRFLAENFQTLDVHRAIANHDNIRIDHSTALLSAKGATMFDSVVIDPWRKGGTLVWMPVNEDKRYEWRPQAEVLEFYKARDAKKS